MMTNKTDERKNKYSLSFLIVVYTKKSIPCSYSRKLQPQIIISIYKICDRLNERWRITTMRNLVHFKYKVKK